jgi:hypothetical protein
MASIVINDLNESKELDKKAMASVLGGSRGTSRYSQTHSLLRKPPRNFIGSARKDLLQK